MKERPILFSGEMVRAILEGRKTQARRVVNPQPPIGFVPWHGIINGYQGWTAMAHSSQGEKCDFNFEAKCPYGQLGDRLWVRETFFYEWPDDYPPDDMRDCRIVYRATEPDYIDDEMREDSPNYRWSPSIHMPRWASRIGLEVTGVRVERVQDISHWDVIAEGGPFGYSGSSDEDFAELWDSINAKRGFGWDVNPWCWVVKFKQV